MVKFVPDLMKSLLDNNLDAQDLKIGPMLLSSSLLLSVLPVPVTFPSSALDEEDEADNSDSD